MTIEKRPRGRPPEAPPKHLCDSAVEWVSEGKTLSSWCRAHDVAHRTIYDWMERDKDFAAKFARARDGGHDVIADECVAIADEDVPLDVNGRRDPGYIAWQKNRIWTRTQLLAKWNPKKYGEKVDVAHGGAITVTVATGIPDANEGD